MSHNQCVFDIDCVRYLLFFFYNVIFVNFDMCEYVHL